MAVISSGRVGCGPGKCAVMLAAQKPVAHRFRSSTPIARRANWNERRPRRRGRIKPVDQIDHVPRHALIAALIGELLPHARDRSQHRLRPWIARLVCHRRALNSRLPKPCGSIFLHSRPPRIPGRIAIAFGTCVQPLRSCEPQFGCGRGDSDTSAARMSAMRSAVLAIFRSWGSRGGQGRGS